MEPMPERSLLLAFQNGKIHAIEGGKKLPREAWACETGSNWPPALRFCRNEVLALWPEQRVERRSPTDAEAHQWLDELKPIGGPVTLKAYEIICQNSYPQMTREECRRLSRRMIGERNRGRPTVAK